jgi:2-polyprenyl-3-methyl-5-hydroxy-6-metoxy-1,4-benzoquinol methylase
MDDEVSPMTVGERSNAAKKVCPACGRDDTQEFLVAPDRFEGRTADYRLLCCPACALVWLENPPKPSEMGQHYTADYDKKIAAGGEMPGHFDERRETLTKYKKGGAVLDLGCSSGAFLETLKGGKYELFGIEMSPEVAKRAEQRTGAKVFVGDILDAPFPKGHFDAITCFHVFEHMYEPKRILEKVSYWLKPDGIFYMMVPNIHSAGGKTFKSYWYALELPRHLFHWSPKALRQVAGSVDLEEVSITTHREVFFEYSMKYILDDFFKKFGIVRTSLAKKAEPGIPFRIVRKAFRLTILPIITGLIALKGDGESIHGVFQKRLSGGE